MEQNDKQEILDAIVSNAKRADEKFAEVVETIASNAKRADEQLTEAISSVSKRSDEKFAEVVETIASNAKRAEDQLTEVIEAINTFATHVEERFDVVDEQFGAMKTYVDTRLAQTETRMVTKEYLDDKLADLSGDLVVLLRKEDRKLGALVTELVSTNVISKESANRILAMELFPQS